MDKIKEFVAKHKVKISLVATALVSGVIGVLAGDTSVGEAIQALITAAFG